MLLFPRIIQNFYFAWFEAAKRRRKGIENRKKRDGNRNRSRKNRHTGKLETHQRRYHQSNAPRGAGGRKEKSGLRRKLSSVACEHARSRRRLERQSESGKPSRATRPPACPPRNVWRGCGVGERRRGACMPPRYISHRPNKLSSSARVNGAPRTERREAVRRRGATFQSFGLMAIKKDSHKQVFEFVWLIRAEQRIHGYARCHCPRSKRTRIFCITVATSTVYHAFRCLSSKKSNTMRFYARCCFVGFHHGQCLWLKLNTHGNYIIHFFASVVNGKMYENRASFARSAAERHAATLPEPKAQYT